MVADYPPIGQFTEINGLQTHYLDCALDGKEDCAVLFLHGASGNLRDLQSVFEEKLRGRIRQIYVDRPGHGYSDRKGRYLSSPKEQAKHIVALLDHLEIDRILIFGHSWGGALALSFALNYPERVKGLVLSAPVSHLWPGGVNWYYPIAASAFWGWFFTRLLAIPFGERQFQCAQDKVFWPNKVPAYYHDKGGAKLVLIPQIFQNNAADIADLRCYIAGASPFYSQIKMPVTLLTGDKDQVLLPWVHCDGLEHDIAGLKRINLLNTGHMPHHTHANLFIDEILFLAKKVGFLERVSHK